MEQLDRMMAQWIELCEREKIPPLISFPVGEEILSAYQSPQRYYHNLQHISEMLKIAGKFNQQFHHRNEVFYAIWFHDIVYDPKAKNNEESSVEAMKNSLSPLGISELSQQIIAELILVTKHEKIPIPCDIDMAILLDADLAILGAETWRYELYTQQIRQEYSFVDDATYRQGRSDFLQKMLSRPWIFQTDRLRELGEPLARKNIQYELDRLDRS